jgi:hypothetical protein
MNDFEQIGPPFLVPPGAGQDAKDAIEEHLFGLGFGLDNWNWIMPAAGTYSLAWQSENGRCTVNLAKSKMDSANGIMLTRLSLT